MKKISFIICLLICTGAGAYDWQHQENEELRSDMITFAKDFASQSRWTKQGRALRKFVRQQKRMARKDAYAWIPATKDFVLKLESMCPPTEDNGSKAAVMRRNILLLLDFPLHADNKHPEAPEALKEAFVSTSASYREEGRRKALEALAAPGPAEPGKLQVIKVYNSGVILRTSARTVAVDIKWEGEMDGASRIAEAADVFFLSHPHRDHYSDVMIQALAAAGKRAVLPSNVTPDSQWDGKTVIFEDRIEPFDVEGIGVSIVTGHQRELPNNAYLLEFDGWRVLLPGENDQHGLYKAFSSLAAPDLILEPTGNRVDITFDIVKDMAGYDRTTTYMIPEHENELTHGVDHRESYRELFTRPDRLGDPERQYPRVFLLDIGEDIVLDK